MNFLEPKDFPFLQTIKERFNDIKDEFLNTSAVSSPWIDKHLYEKGWDVIGLKYEGEVFAENKLKFPVTTEIFESLPVNVFTYGFSIMRPGCEIVPHRGKNHDVLRSHLCIQTNPDSHLIVNDEARNWTESEFLVFDDTELHAAHNRGTTDRVVVLFDFYK